MADFDVFLSHNSRDKPVVREIAARLRDRGLKPWLDEDELRPGLQWQDGLQEALLASKATAVCLGPDGLGDWQRLESGAVLIRFAKEKNLPVIPVFLPGAPEGLDLGIFLNQFVWVNLRSGLHEDLLDRLVWGITGERPKKRDLSPVSVPALHNLPFSSLRDFFKGRADELKSLEATFGATGRTAATQSHVISGLGGIGKTRLAVEYAWRYGHRYIAVFFVRADSKETFYRGLTALAGPALLNLPERQIPAEMEVVASVQRWLREHPGWLLIIDNVDTEDAVRAVGEMLPSLSSGWVLLTSRLSEWPATIHTQLLDPIPRVFAVRFLLERTERRREPAPDDAEQADRLAEVLGDLPLALEQAAAYIEHSQICFADYLKAWASERPQVLDWHNDRLMQYPDPIAGTWQTTFQQLGLTPAALLRLAAFLAPDPIPWVVFEEGFETVKEAVALLSEETGKVAVLCSVHDALKELAAYSMATLQVGRRFVVHRLVQEVLRSQTPKEQSRIWVERLLSTMDGFAPDGPDDVWNLLRPHIIQLKSFAANIGVPVPSSLLNIDLKLLKAKGLYTAVAELFTLEVLADPNAGIVRLRLNDEQGRQLGANEVLLSEHKAALWHGVFDTPAFVRSYANSVVFTDRPATATELLEQIGIFLGEKILGPEIMMALHKGIHHRSLLVRQPDAQENRLATAFARVPWEIARPAAGKEPLLERNLVVRMETPGASSEPASLPPPGPGELLRVLLVFAEAPGSRPLAMRLEREQLLGLFYDEVMPRYRVAVDVLCHGVTRKSLSEKVRDAAGYHVVHWSGHGHHNLLELLGADGKPDRLTGTDLVDLFADAGGYSPQLVFLSACLSGTLVGARDWAALEAALREGEPVMRTAGPESEKIEQLIEEQPGYTGTALALLGAGVPQVVAMRYEVGDAYARDLAGLFYRRLLADTNLKSPASALANARGELMQRQAGEHDPVDHATPLLFGGAAGPLPAPKGRSAALAFRRPQPQPLLPGSRELDRPAELVGRGGSLSQLRRCLEEGRPAVALVQGLAGLGKTALVAEAIHLWHRRFDGVFAFQSKPLPLALEDVLRRLDERLALHSQAYREQCEENPNARIWLPPGQPLSGEARWQKMRDNLLAALRSERLLVVLDNFETQLEKVAGADGYACADPQWDRLLRHLAENLPGTGSRLLVTSRHRLAALADPDKVLWLPLGPLPMTEAMLFLQGNEALRRLAFGDEAGRELALRLLDVSRGHPLILTRLGALAGDREALAQALDALDAQGLDRLPNVFAPHISAAERERERKYLEDVAVGAVDLLIHRASPDARRLLRVVTLAAEPVAEALIQSVWSDEGDAAPPAGPLLAELAGSGLLSVEETGAYGFHELVRERTAAWMETRSEEQGGWTEEQVWIAYGDRYAAAFEALRRVGGEGSRERALEAGRRGISYLVRARAFDRLGSFASGVVTSTNDPRLLHRVIAELEGVVEQVPAGQARWSLRTWLADALWRGGRPEAALPFYEQAAAEAEEAGHWGHVGVICQNWANALGDVGRLDGAKATYLRSARAEERAGSPRANVLGSELEALRIDVMQGGAETALPEVESRLQEVRAWWRWHRAGEPVPEAPDPVFLARVLITSLDIAREANQALERWEACLGVLNESEETKRALGEGEHELARTRFNRYGPLLRLGRLGEAQQALESCLAVFRGAGDLPSEARVLSALADLWGERGDPEQAAGLARQALAVSNRLADLADRSISHGNLADSLDRLGAAEEAARHLMTAIVYDLVTNRRQGLQINMHNLAILMRRAAASGERYELPRLAELLARPEFEPLRRTLMEWKVGLDELQAEIDERVEAVRRGVEGDGSPAPG